jgi:nitrogen fixation/metabolism regulation signal transduction histidine kinase
MSVVSTAPPLSPTQRIITATVTRSENIPLRTKILAFALFLVVFTLIVAVFAFVQRQTLTASVHAGELQTELLKAHNSKSKFVFRRTSNDADDVETYLSRSFALLTHFEREETASNLRLKMQQYLKYFRQLHESIEQRGINENSGAEGEFRRCIHEVQQILQETQQREIEITILQARRREKDFFMRGDESYIGEVRQLIRFAQEQAERSNSLQANDRKRLTYLFAAYIQTFEQTAVLLTNIQKFDTALNLEMDGIQPILSQIVAAKQATAQTVEYVVWGVVVISLLSSVILAFWIAHHLSAPIIKLERAAHLFTTGNYDATVKIRSRD